MRNIVSCVVLVILLSNCDSSKKGKESSAPISEVKEVPKEEVIEQQSKAQPQVVSKKDDNDLGIFRVENEEVLQTIQLKLLTKDSLEFEVISKSKSSNNSSEFKGVALLKVGTEIDEDENGMAYMAKEFVYEDKCWIAIRVDLKSKDKVRVKEADCESLRPVDCPFESVGLMKPAP